MTAVLLRDIRLAFISGSTLVISILFFLAVIVIVPFGIGPAPEVLNAVGPGMIWIAALLAILLGLDRLFDNDHADGSLDIIMLGTDFITLAFTVFIKCLGHWIGTVLPLVIAAPCLALMLNIEPGAIGLVLLTLLLGTPAITLIGAVGAALAVSLPRGGVLISVIVLPLVIPVMIFGVAAANSALDPQATLAAPLLFTLGLTLIFAVVGPVAAAAALKYLSD